MANRKKVIDNDSACALGLTESVVFNQINYWSKKSKHTVNGVSGWFYKTFDKFQKEDFPFLSVRWIKTTIKKLNELKLIEVGEFNTWRADRTKWYKVADDAEAKIKAILEKKHSEQNALCSDTKCTMPKCTKCTSNNHRVTKPKSTDINLELHSNGGAILKDSVSNKVRLSIETNSYNKTEPISAYSNNRLAEITTTLLAKRHLTKLTFELDKPLPPNEKGEYPAEAYQLIRDYGCSYSPDSFLYNEGDDKNWGYFGRRIKEAFQEGATVEGLCGAIYRIAEGEDINNLGSFRDEPIQVDSVYSEWSAWTNKVE